MLLSDEYIAGFFDGEGCITSHMYYKTGKYEIHPRVNVQITISNTSRDVLESIVEKYGGAISSKGCGTNKNCFHLRIAGKSKMDKFLRSILPYSVIKKEQIEIALEFIGTIREEVLGCEPLSKDIHAIRQRVHESLRKCKLPEMRFN